MSILGRGNSTARPGLGGYEPAGNAWGPEAEDAGTRELGTERGWRGPVGAGVQGLGWCGGRGPGARGQDGRAPFAASTSGSPGSLSTPL